MDEYSPIKSKCVWWRESPDVEERYNPTIKPENVKVHCSCFLEGYVWTARRKEVLADCPNSRHCRYYIKHV